MATKRWGWDIDGVFANFDDGMRRLVAETTGRSLFTIGGPVPLVGKGWSETLRTLGYTKAEIEATWKAVLTPEFWASLKPLPGVDEFNAALPDFVHDDIYFITARKGGKFDTENWLMAHTGVLNPTVIMTKQKGIVARALGLDVYVDDRLDLALDVRIESPTTHVYLLDSPHNAYHEIEGIRRVKSLKEMFDIELQEPEDAILEE